MLNFLNSVLDIEGGITDLTYTNTEILGLTKEDRKAIYDLICTTGKGGTDNCRDADLQADAF